jgi:N-acetylmuramoyl-L-alanine amidase/Bacterial SH3 domain
MEKENTHSAKTVANEMPTTGARSLMPPPFGFEGGSTKGTVQMKPEQGGDEYPYEGQIVGAELVAFRSSPSKNANKPNTLADLPRGEKVKVVGRSGAWLKVEWNGRIGYVSQELVKKSAKRPETPPAGYFDYDVQTPERITLKLDGITKSQVAKDLYGDASEAMRLHDVALPGNRELKLQDGPDMELRKGTMLRIEYRFLKPELKKVYDATVNVTSRKDWGAREPNKKDTVDYHPYDLPLEDVYHSVAIHHSGHSNMHTMKEVEGEHRDDNGWADIGYHYAINLKGQVLEGRPIEVRGNHIDAGNTGVIGIVFLADLNEDRPDSFPWIDGNGNDALGKEMEASMVQLVHFLRGKYPNINFLGGHKEFNSKRSCPGNIPMAKMDGWRMSTSLQKPKAVN